MTLPIALIALYLGIVLGFSLVRLMFVYQPGGTIVINAAFGFALFAAVVGTVSIVWWHL